MKEDSPGRTPDNPGVIAPPPLIYLAGFVVGMLVERAVPVAPLPPAIRWAAGAPLAVAAVLLGAWAVGTMHRAGTSLDPRRPATALVVNGPFRFTRNPLYLSNTVLYAGVAVLVDVLWPLVLLPAVLLVIRRGVIGREERYLEAKFGDAYRRYREAVRRWI